MKNIFHAICYINNKIYSVNFDSKSCANVTSSTLVRKLNLNTIKYEKFYKLQWLNDCGEVKVIKQVLLSFSVKKYKDEMLCDVIFIHATHLLLERLLTIW
jgi:hypothetical protein